ncbi:MAG: pyridoxamine 5'-phosphate oxidase family protein [Deltaproteobacteria bacterium]|nr:pyridoxamine 5'-phosphate oxidase family protein [Deltaproteobacteria bacterium]
MSDLENYEQVSIYRLDPEDQEKLLRASRECVFSWCTKDSWPIGVIMSCYWKNGKMWLTAGAHRHRIAAIQRNPQVSVCVTSTGTELGPSKTITIKGRCRVREDRETKAWFYPEFAFHLRREQAAADAFAKMLDSPLRVVLEVTPEKFITYDGIKMFQHTAGTLDPSRLATPLSSDTERLAAELKRRGLRG